MFPARILVLADRAVTAAVARSLLARAGFANVVARSPADVASANGDLSRSDLVVVDVPAPASTNATIGPALRRRGDGGPRVLALARQPAAIPVTGGGDAVEVLAWPADKADLGRRVGQILGVPGLTSPRTDERAREEPPVPRRLADAGLEAEEEYRSLFGDAPAALLVVAGSQARVVTANAAAARLTGYSREELLELHLHDLLLDGDRVTADRGGDGAEHADGERRELCRLLTRRGQIDDVEVRSRPRTFMGEPALVMHIGTPAESRESAAVAAERALRDHEAGLGGQALFHSRLERAVASRGAEERVALLLIAFDRSAPVPRRRGDAALMGAASTLRASVRASDTTAYLGGGRFAVLLEDLRSPSAAPAVALRLLGAVGATPAGSDGDDGSGRDARAGLAFGDLLRSSDELLWRAEQAVCAAREQDQPALVLFQSPLERSVRRHSTLARDLRDALEAGSRSIERGILRVLYQPQVEIATRRVVGVEALVRWWDPAHGEVPPESFIAVAEDVGLIADLDALVLRQTMTDALAWGFDHLPLAVNVSGVELQDPGYADRVIDLLRSSGDGRLRLELEITERVAIEPSSPAGANVARLRAAGVGVSIDDFGTGPAAFTTLRAVAASRIKIDRSFIADIAAGEVRAVAAIVAMARGLGLETIAEGVETPEQCALLVEHGCLVGQGYLFAPPIAAADLVRFVEQAGTSLVGVPVRRAADAGAAHA